MTTTLEVHFHVGQNVPGYMPESDVDFASTKEEAIQLLVERKRQWLDDGWTIDDPVLKGRNRYAITGSARDDLMYWVEDRLGGPHHLGFVIWVQTCTFPECLEEEGM